MENASYKTPFHSSLWKEAAGSFRNVRYLAVCAMFVALHAVLSSVFIPVGENLRIYFTFFLSALGASIYGPFMALAEGFLSDIIGYIIAPSGAFFPGYTLSAMLGSFVYALFFYRQNLSILRIFLCKLLVNIFINVCLGSLWSYLLYGKGYFYYLAKSVVKNLLLLPFETFIMVLVFRTIRPLLVRMKLIPKGTKTKIPII